MNGERTPVRVEGRLDERPSRWLWLVKWLLLIPHYIVLFFLGIAFTVLTVVAFFAILVTGRYPRPIFDLVLGLNRWVLRVAAYAGLMTDVYPPFRLDQGGDDPSLLHAATGTPPSGPAAGPMAGPAVTSWPAEPAGPAPVAGASTSFAPVVPPSTAPSHRWTAGRIVALVAGSVVVIGPMKKSEAEIAPVAMPSR